MSDAGAQGATPAAAGRARHLPQLGRALAGAGVPVLVVSEPPSFPHVELLIARGRARAAQRALAGVSWRWRIGGDGAWRSVRRRRFTFDGGFIVTVHHALPTGPVPALALGSLVRALWADAERSEADELLRPSDAPKLVYLGVQLARGAVRTTAQRAELRAVAAALTEWDRAWSLARKVGVEAPLRRALDEIGCAPPATARAARLSPPALAWRAAGRLREHERRAVAQVLLGEPWRRSLTRCRFDGLELVVGPGTFLPRGVSEQLVRSASQALAALERPVVADVGTGCGAVAFAIARRFPQARVVGLELDERAVTWARRNARRLRMRHVDFAAGSLLDPLPADLAGGVSLITANVPCLTPEAFEGSSDAPAQAYVGADPDGLGLHRTLAADARAALRPGGWLLVQLAPSQWPAYREMLRSLGFDRLEASGGSVAVVGVGRWPGAT